MNTPEQNIINLLKGKRVLFLENDNTLNNGLDEFENILKRGGIDYSVLFELDTMDLKDITAAIQTHDAIIFMTQWVYDIAKKIKEYMFSIPQKKIVIEAYIHEPTWYYKPKTIHDVYIYTCMVYFGEPEKETERFYKLSEDAYWDYENNFDK